MSGDDRLDTGMSAAEAVRRASAWWDSVGRKLVRHYLVERQRTRRRPTASGFVSDDYDRDPANYIPSDLLHGKAFADLGRKEALMVVKAWHHFAVRVPQHGGHVWDRGRCAQCGLLDATFRMTGATCATPILEGELEDLMRTSGGTDGVATEVAGPAASPEADLPEGRQGGEEAGEGEDPVEEMVVPPGAAIH